MGSALKPDDVTRAAAISVAALRSFADEDWSIPSGNGVEWDVRTTAHHVVNALGFYAAQLATRSADDHDEPRLAPTTPMPILLSTIERRAAVLAEVAKAAPPDARGFNGAMTDTDGFIAMGCDEVIVHGHDILKGFRRALDPPRDLCRRVLDRLFPDAPTDGDAWAVLLWANGRGTIPGRAPTGPHWRWRVAPPAADDATARS